MDTKEWIRRADQPASRLKQRPTFVEQETSKEKENSTTNFENNQTKKQSATWKSVILFILILWIVIFVLLVLFQPQFTRPFVEDGLSCRIYRQVSWSSITSCSIFILAVFGVFWFTTNRYFPYK
jgi:uncharacterized ion transporter superfamily protein YfcC